MAERQGQIEPLNDTTSQPGTEVGGLVLHAISEPQRPIEDGSVASVMLDCPCNGGDNGCYGSACRISVELPAAVDQPNMNIPPALAA